LIQTRLVLTIDSQI